MTKYEEEMLEMLKDVSIEIDLYNDGESVDNFMFIQDKVKELIAKVERSNNEKLVQ